jgi:hypothetical protein
MTLTRVTRAVLDLLRILLDRLSLLLRCERLLRVFGHDYAFRLRYPSGFRAVRSSTLQVSREKKRWG